MDWYLLSDAVPQTWSDLEQILLANRQITDVEKFFHPPSPLEFSPSQVGIDEREMHRTLERLAQARDIKEQVVVYGDYDVDGICATTIMWQALLEFGITAHPFIPRREHGYGLTEKSLDELFSQVKPDLIVTVDNGVVAHKVLANEKLIGIDVIITDHHQLEQKDQVVDQEGSDLGSALSKKSVVQKSSEKTVQVAHYPPALAIIHTTSLCGTTVSWMVARALVPDKAAAWLDLCAIATITDQVPLLDFNRSFVVHGLPVLRSSPRVGLQVLCEKTSTQQSSIGTTQINYVIGPRLNALGRLAHNLDGVRLLCTKNRERALSLVSLVEQTNQDRQAMMGDMMSQAMVEASTMEQERILIIAIPGIHEGVIGLIASKLTETFHKPSIVISLGAEISKASARSVMGVHITELIRQVREELVDVGGHMMAGGFSIQNDKITVFKNKLFTIAREQISEKLLLPTLKIECVLPAELVTEDTVDNLEKFAPFGAANREPLFLIHHAHVVEAKRIGQDGKHIKLRLQLINGARIECLGWGMGERLPELDSNISIVGRMEFNIWKGRKKLQLVLKDLCLAE